MGNYPLPSANVAAALCRGMVIPAHPLALTEARKFDEKRQRALTRYYIAAGAGGIAVGVHTTQFEIHNPKLGLYRPVLQLAAETAKECERKSGLRIVKIAGICGATDQAVAEAQLAVEIGYHAGLMSLSALRDANIDEVILHCRRVAEVIPLFGFYLQPAVGGRILDFQFWRRFAEIENVIAIKVAPFNRYQTLAVVRAVAETGAADRIALYTGNDDNIVNDLLTPFRFKAGGERRRLRFVGGLLGHWALWTKKAVELLQQIESVVTSDSSVPLQLLERGAEITDANGAIFDTAHNFAGCIPGIHEVLRRQGLLSGRWCLHPSEELSPGQMEGIDRICAAYPELNDDSFVAQNLDEWMF